MDQEGCITKKSNNLFSEWKVQDSENPDIA